MSDFNFIELFYKKLAEMSPNWEVKGVIDSQKNIYSLGTDSKLIGRIFELKTKPILEAISKDNPQYMLKQPKSQTEYPDYFYECPDGKRIAIDVKTTYIDDDKKSIYYTLGTHQSYLQDNHSGINGEYTDYKQHFVVGFVYTRNKDKLGEYTLDEIDKIESPYKNVEVWVQEKYKITDLVERSGDTANMGSILCYSVKEFKEAHGPFSELDKAICDDYWAFYFEDPDCDKTLEKYFEWAKKKSNLLSKGIDLDMEWGKYLSWRKRYKPTLQDKLEDAIDIVLVCGPNGGRKQIEIIKKGNKSEIIKSKKKRDEAIELCQRVGIDFRTVKYNKR